jgi:asparaginyl-tRNA synthetase
MNLETTPIKSILTNPSLLNANVVVGGWVKSARSQKTLMFVMLNDGSSQHNLQLIINDTLVGDMIVNTGSSLSVRGTIVKSIGAGQNVELLVDAIEYSYTCLADYPFQKAGLPMDFVRQFSHLKVRTNTVRAVMVVKSQILKATHRFFDELDYHLVMLPMITTNACESGCQPLQVTSMLNQFGSKVPTLVGGSDIDYQRDFFKKPAYLTVSNQLHLEAVAHGLGKVYTLTNAVRGEASMTSKHLAEFTMLEWEFCFGDLKNNMDMAEAYIKYVIRHILIKCADEMNFLDKIASKPGTGLGLIDRLKELMECQFVRMTHHDAVLKLRDAHNVKAFEVEPKFDEDLSGEHEKYLVDMITKRPTFVLYYPSKVKAFYMPEVKQSQDSVERVDCFDLLAPKVGELVGGSQRICDYFDLVDKMNRMKMNVAELEWYVSSRRFGSVVHGGAGLGMDRFVMLATGMDNIRDTVMYPRTVGMCEQ